jgi:hypothetical protein
MFNIRFWALLSELNNLTTILSIKCPEYSDRVGALKEELTDMIDKEVEQTKKMIKIERSSYRNN